MKMEKFQLKTDKHLLDAINKGNNYQPATLMNQLMLQLEISILLLMKGNSF